MFKLFKRENITAYFNNGVLIKVEPDIGDLYENRDKYYNLKYIVIDGKRYDLEDINSINSIEVNHYDYFGNSSLGVTGNLVYVLRMKASHLKDDGKIDLALALEKKVTEQMPASGIMWSKKDYMRYADWLFEVGKKQEGYKAAQCVNELFAEIEAKNTQIIEQKTEEVCDDLGTDLVEATYFFGCCSVCAKFRGRWFSITGKDNRFPKKPIINNCMCSGLDFNPVFIGISEPTYKEYFRPNDDIISFSNRPFIDDRSEREMEYYNNDQKEKDIAVWYEPYRIRLLSYKHKTDVEYQWVCDNLPEIAPKSVNGYSRMKNSNSKGFQKLADEAEKKGYSLRLTEEEEEDLRFLNECKSKYNNTIAECNAFRRDFTQ